MRWELFLQKLRLWLWCVGALAFVELLPNLGKGIRGVTLYVPNLTEVVAALLLAFFGVMLEEKINGGKLAKTPAAYNRMRITAILMGLSGVSVVVRFLEGLQ